MQEREPRPKRWSPAAWSLANQPAQRPPANTHDTPRCEAHSAPQNTPQACTTGPTTHDTPRCEAHSAPPKHTPSMHNRPPHNTRTTPACRLRRKGQLPDVAVAPVGKVSCHSSPREPGRPEGWWRRNQNGTPQQGMHRRRSATLRPLPRNRSRPPEHRRPNRAPAPRKRHQNRNQHQKHQ